MDKLLAWAESLYQFACKNPQYSRLETYWDFRGVDPDRISHEVFVRFEKQNNELADGLRAIFRQGINDGSMRPDLDIDMCISQFLYSLRSILNRTLSKSYSFATFDSDKYVRYYLDLFSRGIRNHKGVF